MKRIMWFAFSLAMLFTAWADVAAQAPATSPLSGEVTYSGPLSKIGGSVSSPVLTHKVEPTYSEEARKAKFMGIVLVSLVVDSHGMPQNVHVPRGVGMGLDQKAVEAVRQYRFKPALEKGKPVAVELNVLVSFQIF